jgi:hypothetical protein
MSTKSRALKAKATRRIAKPKEPGDAVSVLLRDQRKRLKAISVLNEKANKSPADRDWYRQMERVLLDRADSAIDELSYLKPKTKDGAVFALVAAYGSLSEMDFTSDGEIKQQRKRRAFRLMYNLLHYLVGRGGYAGCNLGDWPGDNLNRVIRRYQPPWTDPTRDLTGGMSYAESDEEFAS